MTADHETLVPSNGVLFRKFPRIGYWESVHPRRLVKTYVAVVAQVISAFKTRPDLRQLVVAGATGYPSPPVVPCRWSFLTENRGRID
jgi:hypothetical protein